MISPVLLRPLCICLSLLIAAPSALAQVAPAPAPAGAPLTIAVLEGNKTVNSLSLLRSIPPVVEVRDQNDFPVEGATVVFTLPEEGPGGIFAGGGSTFSTRSDSHGQATTPAIVPKGEGKFEIKVSATSGNRKGDGTIVQTNATGEYSGPTIAPRPWYKKRAIWIVAGGAVAGGIAALVLTRSSSSTTTSGNTISITPGPPVFH
jgi:hypothetical protein